MSACAYLAITGVTCQARTSSHLAKDGLNEKLTRCGKVHVNSAENQGMDKVAKGKTPAGTRDDLIRENEQLKQRLSTRRTSLVISSLTELGKWLIGGIVLSVCVYFLAGQVTLVDAKLDLGASIGEALKEIAENLWIDLFLIVGMTASTRAAYRYRRINKSLVQQVSEKTKRLERIADPNRSSSNLGTDGETHKGDV